MSISLKRFILWKKNPYCFYCGRKTKLYNPHSKEYPDDEMTIDHIKTKYEVERWSKPKKNEIRYVTACRRCNGERGRILQYVHENMRYTEKPIPKNLGLEKQKPPLSKKDILYYDSKLRKFDEV